MLYLIGGPPRTGKTTLAAMLAQKTGFPHFSVDHVAQVITPYIPSAEQAERLPLRRAIQDAGYDNDALYRTYSAEQIVALYRRQAETVRPGLENFIRYALDADHDFIIEGWQLIPSRLRAAIGTSAGVKVLFVYKVDELAIVSGLTSHRGKNDWVVQNTRDEATFEAIARMISGFGAIIQREASANGFRAINTDVAFEATLAAAAGFFLA